MAAVVGGHLRTDVRHRGCGNAVQLAGVATPNPRCVGPPKGLMRHEHRPGLLMHEVEGHPSEQPFEKQRNGTRSETARRAKA